MFLSAAVAVGMMGCNGEKQNIDNDVTVSGNETPKISIKIQSPSSENVLVTKAVGDKIAAEPDEAQLINLMFTYLKRQEPLVMKRIILSLRNIHLTHPVLLLVEPLQNSAQWI